MQDFIKAGKITKKAITYARNNIKKGVNIYDFVNNIEQKIFDMNASLAFPVNISIGSDAAHDTADYESKEVFKKGDLVKVDLGASVNGFVGDCAFTAEIGTNNHLDLIKASREALNQALEIIKPGVKVREIGKKINKVISKYDFKPIKNLGGHGLGQYNLHAGLFIPNYDNGDNTKLSEGQMVAIEPFATNGRGMVKNKNIVKIFGFEKSKPVRLPGARKIQNYVKKNFNKLPFAKHHLLKAGFTRAEVGFGLRELVKKGVLHSYPILSEAGKGLVSQAEHSVLVSKEPIITTL